MDKFEYTMKVEYKSIVDHRWLNGLGSKGWELINIIEGTDGETELLRYYFKRKLEKL